MHPVVPAGLWCALLLGGQWALARGYGRRRPFAPAAGSPAAGVRYAFTGALLPRAKESVRRHPASWAGGVAFHLGVAAAFAQLLVPGRILGALCLLGALAGTGLLLKRIVQPHLRGLSGPDDYISNGLATACAFIGGLGPARALPWALAALLLYVPLGKLRHCAFFFLTRYHLGAFFGRRGTFPPGAGHART